MCQRALSNIHSQLYGLEREAVPQFPAAEVSREARKELKGAGNPGLFDLLDGTGI